MDKKQRIWISAAVMTAVCPVVYGAAALTIDVNQSQTLPIAAPSKVAVANPEIADVAVLSDEDVLVIGKKKGSTTLYAWDGAGTMHSYLITVADRDTGTADIIYRAIGYPGVRVAIIGETVLLEGQVEDQSQMQRAVQIASAYSGKVSNMLEMTEPKNIDIEVRVLEISESGKKDLGVDLGVLSTDSDGNSVLGSAGSFILGQGVINPDAPGQWGSMGTYAPIGAAVNALITSGKARLLSAPHIVTMSGEKARIQIGGQIPVPVSTDDNTIQVEWKDYGILLNIEPTVDSKMNIKNTVQAEVSSLDSANAVGVGNGISIPALRTRHAESVITMPSGNTMLIGGLISSDESKYVSKIPLLGDLPLIGELFKHRNTRKERTELIILVTPRVLPYQPAEMKLSKEMKAFKEETQLEPEVSAQEYREKMNREKAKAKAVRIAINESSAAGKKRDYFAEALEKEAKNRLQIEPEAVAVDLNRAAAEREE